MPTLEERRLFYPKSWEAEYRKHGHVREWLRRYPQLYGFTTAAKRRGMLSARPQTLDLFAQYALQFLLRESDLAESITWYKLRLNPDEAVDRDRVLEHWRTMKKVMGSAKFNRLQRAIVADSSGSLTGEPDLFCWTPDGRWFFAEAKRADAIGPHQRRWFAICEKALGEGVDIRVYRVKAAK